MNKERRKELTRITDELRSLYHDLTALNDEERDAFENMPEAFQQSDKGQERDEIIDKLDTASGCISDALDYLDDCSA